MDRALWHKFTQHSELEEELLATGDAELIEVRPISSSLIPGIFLLHNVSDADSSLRTRRSTHSGALEQMEREGMSLERRLRGLETS